MNAEMALLCKMLGGSDPIYASEMYLEFTLSLDSWIFYVIQYMDS